MPPIIKRYTKSDSTNAKSMVEIRKKRQAQGEGEVGGLKDKFSKATLYNNPALAARLRGAQLAAATDTTMNKALGEAHGGDATNVEDLRTVMKIRKKK